MTHQSIEQLKLYPPETKFTVKAKNFETGEIKIIKNQTAETYPKLLSYLKYLNANGYNIFLSPSVAGEGETKATASNCMAYIEKVYNSVSSDDISGLDFKAALYGIRKGFTQDEIKTAILKFSPNIQNRKKGHIDDYLLRTVKNASLK